MFNHSFKSKYKKCFIVCILVMAMLLTASMPINAMGENEQPESNTEKNIEVQAEAADDMEAAETVSADAQKNKSNPPSEQTVQATESNESVVSEPEQVEEADADIANIEDERILAQDTATEAPDVVGTIDKANQWQIVSEEYSGREQANKKGYDIDKDGIDDVYYQKNVIPTGVENEFRVYLGITKKMSWDELLAESDFGVTTSKKYKTEGALEDRIVGNDSLISPGKSTSGGNNYEAVVTFTRGGKVVHTYRGWYHGTTPNCSNGTGFIVLKSLNTNLIASCGVNLQNGSGGTGGQLNYTINLDTMENKGILFAVEDIVVDTVQDTMGEFIDYEGIESCDGTNTTSDNTLIWNPVSNGASGVQVREGNGLTGYHYNIHQLVYKVHLKVEKDGFNSCAQNMTSQVGDKESYQTNQQAILNCHMGGYSGNTQFQVPYVRGLLYDLEFQKIIKDSKVSISGIQFTVNRKQEGSLIAETLEKSDQQTTDDNGWIKFHNLPWGTYTLQELAGSEDSFQNDYLSGAEQNGSYEVKIGKVINSDALSNNHGTGHSVDWASDINNMLFKYNGNSIFENTPNKARITIKKVVNEYDKLSDDLKKQEYSVKTTSVGKKDIYLLPAATDSFLKKLENKENTLKHEETVTYDLIVPKNGGTINLQEVIPESIKNKVVFDSATVTANAGSTDLGSVTEKNQGCEVTVLPGNDLTVTITNTPVGTVKIKKVIDNYQKELAEDAFIIQAESAGDNGTSVNTEAVLKHNESSGTITIKKTTTLNINEIVPKEYSLSKITISGGGMLNGNQVTVNPGENIVVTVHNTYSGKPFFHASDAIKNIFKWK
ncbi:MAG: hypothetical protein JTJ20_12725 [Blautia sp.]|nr:hypothetical protein [Blautia sp.]